MSDAIVARRAARLKTDESQGRCDPRHRPLLDMGLGALSVRYYESPRTTIGPIRGFCCRGAKLRGTGSCLLDASLAVAACGSASARNHGARPTGERPTPKEK